MRQGLSLYGLHKERWKDGCGSECCGRAGRVVLAKGKIPCDILLCGEAPGESEDVLGIPFVGPAGKLLDEIIRRGISDNYRIALTNVVGCIPRDEAGDKAGEPEPEQIGQCRERLEEFIALANPRLIVAVGKTAGDVFSMGYKHSCTIPEGCYVEELIHPAAILRANYVSRGLLIQRCVARLQDAVERYMS